MTANAETIVYTLNNWLPNTLRNVLKYSEYKKIRIQKIIKQDK